MLGGRAILEQRALERRHPMRNQFIGAAQTLAALTLLSLVPTAAQTPTAAAKVKATATAKTWTLPRTPDGQPDIQGIWTNGTMTPLERPKDLGDREFLTEQE